MTDADSATQQENKQYLMEKHPYISRYGDAARETYDHIHNSISNDPEIKSRYERSYEMAKVAEIFQAAERAYILVQQHAVMQRHFVGTNAVDNPTIEDVQGDDDDDEFIPMTEDESATDEPQTATNSPANDVPTPEEAGVRALDPQAGIKRKDKFDLWGDHSQSSGNKN